MDFPWHTIITYNHRVDLDDNYLNYITAARDAFVESGKTPSKKADYILSDEENSRYTYYRSWTDEQLCIDWIAFIKAMPGEGAGVITATYEAKE